MWWSGLQGTVKGLTAEQLEELDCHVILGNTYHLGVRPKRPHKLQLTATKCH